MADMLDEQLFALLNPLVSGRCWPSVAEQGAVAPYIIYQEVVSPTSNTLDGATDLQNFRYQIDIYARSSREVSLISAIIDRVISLSALQNMKLNGHSSRDPDTKLHRSTVDYSIWAKTLDNEILDLFIDYGFEEIMASMSVLRNALLYLQNNHPL